MTHYLLDNGHNINCLGVDNITFYFILYLPWSRHQRYPPYPDSCCRLV